MEKNMPQGDPLVSIRCTVYNHEPFLRQCLDGFVMQETTFPFEAIVHDDASTDGSAAIIREYAEKYPHIIKPIYETENQYGKGIISKNMDAVMNPNSKYIALCEGDDYWTDPHKLQIQVDFLESHPDYFMSCHNFTFFCDDTKTYQKHRFVEELPLAVFNGRKYCTPTMYNYFYSAWFAQTLTIVHRNQEYVEAAKLKKYKSAVDYIKYYYLMKAGKCALFKDVMGVYRRHQGGVYTGRNDLKWTELAFENYCSLYQLENDKLALVIGNIQYTTLFLSYFHDKRYKALVGLVKKYCSVVPLKIFLDVTIRCSVKSLLGERISKIIGIKVLRHGQ